MFVRIAAGAVAGIDAVTVSVEVNVAAAGQLGLFLVGLPDNAVKESEQRIRSAFENTGLRMTGKKSRILLFFWYPLCSLFLFHTQSQLLFLFLPALFAPQIFL